jgi:hypothetical protein
MSSMSVTAHDLIVKCVQRWTKRDGEGTYFCVTLANDDGSEIHLFLKDLGFFILELAKFPIEECVCSQ